MIKRLIALWHRFSEIYHQLKKILFVDKNSKTLDNQEAYVQEIFYPMLLLNTNSMFLHVFCFAVREPTVCDALS